MIPCFLNTIEQFEPITLTEMDKVTLLNRTDTKFVFHRDELDGILQKAKDHYRALVVKGMTYADYDTNYFDTDNFKFYLDHHNKRSNRYKVRMRSYVNSDLHFFEVKFKSNKNRTIKSRIKIDKQTNVIEGESAHLLKDTVGINPNELQRKIQINCKRITLVNKKLTERVTIDFDLRYNVNQEWYDYPDIVIIEVKQDLFGKSMFMDIMRSIHIRPMSLSKYCFGIANYTKGIKYNHFKKQILYVNKISKRYAG